MLLEASTGVLDMGMIPLDIVLGTAFGNIALQYENLLVCASYSYHVIM